jgi:hypothetical protein
MAKRRPLTAGIKSSADQKKEAAFVYGQKSKSKNRAAGAGSPDQPAGPTAGRSPLSTRIRSDLAAALKQASLKRQLSGETPNTVQDILEGVLEPWLRENGYLS